jgi:hypothetical protein
VEIDEVLPQGTVSRNPYKVRILGNESELDTLSDKSELIVRAQGIKQQEPLAVLRVDLPSRSGGYIVAEIIEISTSIAAEDLKDKYVEQPKHPIDMNITQQSMIPPYGHGRVDEAIDKKRVRALVKDDIFKKG